VLDRPTLKPEELSKFLSDLEAAGNDIVVKKSDFMDSAHDGKARGGRWYPLG